MKIILFTNNWGYILLNIFGVNFSQEFNLVFKVQMLLSSLLNNINNVDHVVNNQRQTYIVAAVAVKI